MPDIARESGPTTDDIFASIRRMLTQDTNSHSSRNIVPSATRGGTLAANEIEPTTVEPELRNPSTDGLAHHEASQRSMPEHLMAERQPAPPRIHGSPMILQSAASDAIATLSTLMDEIAPESSHDDHGLENVPRELLKRAIQAWIDATLPSLVEGILRDEIRSIVRAAKRV